MNQRPRLVPAAILLLMCLAAAARGQAPAPSAAPTVAPSSPAIPQPGDELHFYVLTMGPGDDVWEKFGHNALRVVDDNVKGDYHDVAYNWGTFSFEDGVLVFCARFVQDRLMYSMTPQKGGAMVDYYQKDLNRSVYQQELNLSREAKLALRERLFWTDTDAHRFYKYDYYRDNCSTRVRDVVNGATGGLVAKETKGVPANGTFRYHTRRHVIETPWLYLGLQAVLGHPVDRPISRWDEMFLPLVMHDELNKMKVPDPNGAGTMVPLVREEKVLYKSTRPEVPLSPPNTVGWFLLVGVLYSIVLLSIGHFIASRRLARWGFVIVVLPWLLLIGLGGSFLVYAWFCTDHVVTSWNENILHVSPLMVLMIVLLPRLVFGKRKWAEAARWIAVVAAGVSVIGLVLKVLPAFYQVNGDIIALALPVNLAIAFITWKLADAVRPNAEPENEENGDLAPKAGRRVSPPRPA